MLSNCLCKNWQLHKAASALQKGRLVAYPTEAVFGLGCDPWDQKAVQKLLHLKQRPSGKGLILIGSCWQHFAPFIRPLTLKQKNKIAATWPGPVTWVVPAASGIPAWLTGGRRTIAIRHSSHPTAQKLCDTFGGAIISTSANRHGQKACRTAYQVRFRFGRALAIVLGGPTLGFSKPSEIRDLLSGRLIRT